MSLRTEVLHSLKWLAAARFIGQIVAWGVTLAVIRILQPSDYGLMAIAEIMIGFALLFREMGLYEAIVQKQDLTSNQTEQAFGFLLITNSAVYLLLFIFAPLFATFFHDERLTSIVRVLGVQFPLAAFGVVQDGMLSRNMNFKPKSFVNLAAVLGNSFTTLAFALSGTGVWSLVYGSLAGSVLRPIGLVLAAGYWCRPRFSRTDMGDMLRFGGFVTTSRIIWYVYSQADVFIIGRMLGNEILGFYAVAMRLASLPMQKVSELLSQVSLAAYSSVQTEMDVLRSHYCKAIRVLGFISFPVFWGISSVSPDLVLAVLGQRWEQAIIPLQLLSLMMPIRMISHGGGGIMTAIGKPQIGTLNISISFVIMVPAFFIGTWYGGLVGVSLAWVFAYPIVWLIRLRIILPLIGLTIREYLRCLAGPASAAAVMYATVMLARETIVEPLATPVPGLLCLIGTGALVYATFMWFVQRDQCQEVIALMKKQQ